MSRLDPDKPHPAHGCAVLGRRGFIKSTLAAAVTGAVGGRFPGAAYAQRSARPAPAGAAPGWKNWSGSVTCNPAAIERPTSEDEVQSLVLKARADGLPIRLVGTGHSFTPLCATDGVLMSLAELKGVVSTDLENLEATVWGGTKLRHMGGPLRAAGLAMENLPDVDRQAIAGAIATGTHGTGKGIGSLSTQVTGLRIVTATGEILECSADARPDIFKAAKVSLGALGIVTQVRMRLVPTYRLHEKGWSAPFEECFAQMEESIRTNRHFEFFWVSQSDACSIKTLNPTDRMPDELPDIEGERIGHSDRIFPSIRSRRFNEIEFSMAEEQGPQCLLELRELMRTKHTEVLMPLEYRTLAADDIYLSTAYGRDTVTISAHRLAYLSQEAFFSDVEAVFRNHGARPHWGKMHTHGAAELAGLYPMWEKFQAARRELDPEGRFMNAHLKNIFEA